jgi:cytochrome o ubiquinol oxidase operon protein cyoD
MATKSRAVVAEHGNGHGSFYSYVSGYVLSITLTLFAYLLVKPHVLARRDLLIGIIVLALTQLVVQLVFFLHLSQDSRPRWRLWVFLFMIMVVTIIVAGSVWIMHNLNYTGTPQQMTRYMRQNEGL